MQFHLTAKIKYKQMKKYQLFPLLFIGIFALLFLVFSIFIPKQKKIIKPLISYVNPIVGTGGHGHTYPGASMPFGMVQLSPDTRLTGWDGCSGYHYSDSIIYGFSHTHLSGTGCSDYGDILFMPMSHSYSYSNGFMSDDLGYSSVFNHNTEISEPGYYAVYLETPDVDVELTTSNRTGFHKYHFNSTDSAFIIIDLSHRDEVLESGLKQINQTDIAGFRRSKAWAENQYLYFYARFSQPVNSLFYKSNHVELNENWDIFGKDIKAAAGFYQPKEKNIFIQVGISPVSVEGAKLNLENEIGKLDFETVKSLAQSAWNDELSKILIRGDKEKMSTFYTALYHTFLSPNLFNDVDRKYRGTDNKIHQSKKQNQYTVFSLWDTYRAVHPLFTITQTQRTQDFIQTMLNQYQQGGKLPVWELAGNYTGCMIGYHSVPVIFDAWNKGINNFDEELALQAMIHTASQNELGLKAYKSKAYISVEDEHESVSKTLEYAFDDWCIAQMANSLGNDTIYKKFIQRAQNYKNLYDSSSHMMRPKINANWLSPFDPAEVNFNYTEANAWQYSFYVPHDILTWIDMLGGADSLENLLDALFSASSKTSGRHQVDITGLIGQYAHGNEPSHHIAYLYNYCGKAWKTQKIVKQIMHEMYSNQPDGYIGNEDCGQMSAWYVFSALGFYPVNPANGIYDIGSPMFDTAIIQLENAKKFSIIAHNLTDDNIYVQSLKLNGNIYNKTYIHHSDIMNGGTLEFTMGAKPNYHFGTAKEAIYPSKIMDYPITISPVISTNKRTFTDSMLVEINSPQEADYYFTINFGNPSLSSKKYESPFYIYEDAVLKAIAVLNGQESKIVTSHLTKTNPNIKLKLFSEYSSQYSGGGDLALIDGIRGGKDFRTGQWQGFDGKNLVLELNIGEEKPLSSIGIGFLQDIKSWIWMPKKLNISVADKTHVFHEIGTNTPNTNASSYGQFTENMTIQFNQENVQYIRIEAENYGKIPDWHPGAGNSAWIFADEIFWK
jgi:predicted alpha-1,2-mannosidase